jgi:hypothetical protein
MSVPLREHLDAVRAGDQALAAERDRRYSELAIEREKALKIKELADERALKLQAETQQYKDEKANELREQIASERGLYVTRDELGAAVREIQATIKPLTEITTQGAGAAVQRTETRLNVNTLLQAVAVLLAAGIVYAAFHK